MQRLLVAAVSAALLASFAAPALADDYPPCTDRGQDHCRVGMGHMHGMVGHHHHHHGHSHKH